MVIISIEMFSNNLQHEDNDKEEFSLLMLSIQPRLLIGGSSWSPSMFCSIALEHGLWGGWQGQPFVNESESEFWSCVGGRASWGGAWWLRLSSRLLYVDSNVFTFFDGFDNSKHQHLLLWMNCFHCICIPEPNYLNIQHFHIYWRFFLFSLMLLDIDPTLLQMDR